MNNLRCEIAIFDNFNYNVIIIVTISLFCILANNIFLTFTFNENIPREQFPLNIRVELHGWIECSYLEKCPSTEPRGTLLALQSNRLTFERDTIKYDESNGKQTNAIYKVTGVGDYGEKIEKIYIWQENLDLNALVSIELTDDIRDWQGKYTRCFDDSK